MGLFSSKVSKLQFKNNNISQKTKEIINPPLLAVFDTGTPTQMLFS
jgi:hypothetical protein